jgi:hypothetical protein
MIDQVSELLRHLFVNEVPDLLVNGSTVGVSADQVRFEPPDDDFAALRNNITVTTTGAAVKAPVLNAYLIDLRENRKLRSNERMRTYTNGMAFDEPAPARVECHYLITAWVPGTPAINVEPVLDEQRLLYQVLVALFQNTPLNPSRLTPPLTGLDPLIQDADLPTTAVPVDGFPKLGEFWGTMEPQARWRPAVYLVITVPVAYRQEISGPLVTTKSTTFGLNGARETFIQIGGVVTKSGTGVGRVWLGLEAAGRNLGVTRSDAQGRFRFDGLIAGSYSLRVRAPGQAEKTVPLTVPSPAGGYEVTL